MAVIVAVSVKGPYFESIQEAEGGPSARENAILNSCKKKVH